MMVGERIYLRPPEPDDSQTMALAYAQETDDFTDDFGRYVQSPIMFRESFKSDGAGDTPGSMTMMSCLRENDRLIGWLGLVDIDWVNRTAETFSHFMPGEWRGRGYGTESKHLLLEYAFDHVGLHVIQSFVWEANERSARALGRQGYQPTGRRRWENTRRGVYLDALLFDVKRDEWLAARDAWLERRARERTE